MALVERDANLPAAAVVVESTRIGPDLEARNKRQAESAARARRRLHARSQASQEETDRKNAERARKAREKRRSAAAQDDLHARSQASQEETDRKNAERARKARENYDPSQEQNAERAAKAREKQRLALRPRMTVCTRMTVRTKTLCGPLHPSGVL